MKLSIAATKRKEGIERVITFYLDEKNVRHVFKTLGSVDRVYLSLVDTSMGPCLRMHPLLKTATAPAGVLPVPLRPLKAGTKKQRTYVARCVVPSAWKLPLLSRNKSNADFLPSQTEDTLDPCLDLPVPKEWLDKAALKEAVKAEAAPKAPPVEKVVSEKTKDEDKQPAADKRMEGKIQSKPAVVKPIRVEPIEAARRDSQDVRDILAQIEHLTGNLNNLLAVARAQGVNLDVTVKKNQFRVYRYIPARRKRLV